MLGEVTWQAVRLCREPHEPGPATCRPAITRTLTECTLDVAGYLTCIPSLAAPRDPLYLASRQTQHFAELADSTTRPVCRKRSDKRGTVVSIAFMDPGNELLSDVARKVEVDVRQ